METRFSDLPIDVFGPIVSHIDFFSFVQLLQVSHALNKIFTQDCFWQSIQEKQFPKDAQAIFATTLFAPPGYACYHAFKTLLPEYYPPKRFSHNLRRAFIAARAHDPEAISLWRVIYSFDDLYQYDAKEYRLMVLLTQPTCLAFNAAVYRNIMIQPNLKNVLANAIIFDQCDDEFKKNVRSVPLPIDHFELPDDKGMLQTAAMFNALNCAAYLIEQGADVNKRYHPISPREVVSKPTSIYFAAQCGHLSMVQLLLKNGAIEDTFSIDEAGHRRSMNALVIAAAKGHHQVVKLLALNGWNVNFMCQWTSISPLYLAMKNGHAVVVQVLLECGSVINNRIEGHSPLSIAVEARHLAAVKVYLEYCAAHEDNLYFDIDEILHRSLGIDTACTVLQMAIHQRNAPMVDLLLSHGADPNEVADISPPLSVALWNYDKEMLPVIRSLLHAGATDIQFNNGSHIDGHDSFARLVWSFKMISGIELADLCDATEKCPCSMNHVMQLTESFLKNSMDDGVRNPIVSKFFYYLQEARTTFGRMLVLFAFFSIEDAGKSSVLFQGDECQSFIQYLIQALRVGSKQAVTLQLRGVIASCFEKCQPARLVVHSIIIQKLVKDLQCSKVSLNTQCLALSLNLLEAIMQQVFSMQEEEVRMVDEEVVTLQGSAVSMGM